MSATNGSGSRPALASARPVALVRYRPGVAGEAARMVHLIPLPNGGQEGAAHTLCGVLLCTADIEIVTPGHGMPCSSCVVSHVADSPPPPTDEPSHTTHPDSDPRAAAADYQTWGWPVTVRRDQVWLNLEPDIVALIIPVPMATKVAMILTVRRCLPPVLAHPYAPEHRVLLAPMSGYRVPLWRDPLFSPGDRFPLGPSRGIMDNCREGPSGPATRPFSLRHVVAGTRLDTPPIWRYTYCPQRQIALVHDEDGSLVPLLKHTQPGPTPPTDTSGVVDGNPKNPPPEEMMNPDYQAT